MSDEKVKKWSCVECGYVHEGDTPPNTCVVCGAPSSAFVELEDK